MLHRDGWAASGDFLTRWLLQTGNRNVLCALAVFYLFVCIVRHFVANRETDVSNLGFSAGGYSNTQTPRIWLTTAVAGFNHHLRGVTPWSEQDHPTEG